VGLRCSQGEIGVTFLQTAGGTSERGHHGNERDFVMKVGQQITPAGAVRVINSNKSDAKRVSHEDDSCSSRDWAKSVTLRRVAQVRPERSGGGERSSQPSSGALTQVATSEQGMIQV
jgi:hypothetical protein